MSDENGILQRFIVPVLLFALAAACWCAQVYWVAQPPVEDAGAPGSAFAAARAEAVLKRLLGPERPHSVSTIESAAVRARILRELTALGIPVSVRSKFVCNGARGSGFLSCGSVNDVLAEVVPGKGRAIVLMAHYDSVPAGPGAADDESSVAAIIEVARALKAQAVSFPHPVLALFTDGEEAGLLGAAAFLSDPKQRAQVGAVLNAEARGNRGRSLLFQTSAGNGPLIDLYASSLSIYAATSLYGEVYRFLPNDTDLTLFIRSGFPSLNFAFAGDVAQYHTALDTRANLDPRSVQQQGDNLLGLTRGLEQADLNRLRGENEIYLDLLGRLFLHIPAAWALPLSIAAFGMLLAASCLVRDRSVGRKRWVCAFLATPTLLLGAGAGGWLLYTLAQYVSGMPDPSYAYPTFLRLSLTVFIGALTLLVGRFAPPRATAAACWLWIACLGIVVAVLLPGLAPYFLVPCCIAAPLLLGSAMLPGRWEGMTGQTALVLSAVPALLLWVGLGAEGESVMGLKLHLLVTIPIALGLTTLVPLFAAHPLPRFLGGALAAALAMVAIVFSVFAGMLPAFSAAAPQRLNITYVEEDGRARWAVDALAPIPNPLRTVAHFAAKPEKLSPFAWSSLYVAPAGTTHDAPPTAEILSNQRDKNCRHVVLAIHGSNLTQQMFLILKKPTGPIDIDVNGWHFAAPPEWAPRNQIVIACMTRDCAAMRLDFRLSSPSPLDAILGEQHFGLPAGAAALLAARPKTAVPSQNGDGVLLIRRLHIPSI